MKKVRIFTLSLILIFITAFSAGATTLSDSFKIEGYVRDYISVTVTELEETGSLGYGMPFDITKADVKYTGANVISYNVSDSNHIVSYKVNDSTVDTYNAYLGRLIAKWDFSSKSSKVTLTIKANPMTCTSPTDDSSSSDELNYYLTFKYKYESFVNGVSTSSFGYISVDSSNSAGTTVTLQNIDGEVQYQIIVSSQQEIRFMFKEEVTDSVLKKCPSGLYSATVTIQIVGA